MSIVYVKPVIELSMRQICKKPYFNHKHGCPNYGKRPTCPPFAPLVYDFFDMSKPILAVWVALDLELHREKIRIKHKDWSKRQLDCCLYWQGTLLKRLRRDVEYNLHRHLFNNAEHLIVTYVPEAMGVNVTATMMEVGVVLEWPPEKTVIKVAFIGVKKIKNRQRRELGV